MTHGSMPTSQVCLEVIMLDGFLDGIMDGIMDIIPYITPVDIPDGPEAVSFLSAMTVITRWLPHVVVLRIMVAQAAMLVLRQLRARVPLLLEARVAQVAVLPQCVL